MMPSWYSFSTWPLNIGEEKRAAPISEALLSWSLSGVFSVDTRIGVRLISASMSVTFGCDMVELLDCFLGVRSRKCLALGSDLAVTWLFTWVGCSSVSQLRSLCAVGGISGVGVRALRRYENVFQTNIVTGNCTRVVSQNHTTVEKRETVHVE